MGEKLSAWFKRTKTPVSVKFLCDRYLVSDRTVRDALKKLQAANEIKVYRVGRTTFYKGV